MGKTLESEDEQNKLIQTPNNPGIVPTQPQTNNKYYFIICFLILILAIVFVIAVIDRNNIIFSSFRAIVEPQPISNQVLISENKNKNNSKTVQHSTQSNSIKINQISIQPKLSEQETKLAMYEYPKPSARRSEQQLSLLSVTYIWLGSPLPAAYAKKLQTLEFNYKLILNCDDLIARIQKQLGKQFKFKALHPKNVRSNLCRFIQLYYHGGLYMDLDTGLSMSCMRSFLKDKQYYFQVNPHRQLDIYCVYFGRPFHKQLRIALQKWDFHHTNTTSVIASLREVKRVVLNSRCMTHTADGTWQKHGRPKINLSPDFDAIYAKRKVNVRKVQPRMNKGQQKTKKVQVNSKKVQVNKKIEEQKS